MKKISSVDDMGLFLDGASEAQHGVRLGIHGVLEVLGIKLEDEDIDNLRDEVCWLINRHVLQMLRDNK